MFAVHQPFPRNLAVLPKSETNPSSSFNFWILMCLGGLWSSKFVPPTPETQPLKGVKWRNNLPNSQSFLGAPSNLDVFFFQVHHLASFDFLCLWLPNLQQKKPSGGIFKKITNKNPKKTKWSTGIWIYLDIFGCSQRHDGGSFPSFLPWTKNPLGRLILPTLGRLEAKRETYDDLKRHQK